MASNRYKGKKKYYICCYLFCNFPLKIAFHSSGSIVPKTSLVHCSFAFNDFIFISQGNFNPVTSDIAHFKILKV